MRVNELHTPNRWRYWTVWVSVEYVLRADVYKEPFDSDSSLEGNFRILKGECLWLKASVKKESDKSRRREVEMHKNWSWHLCEGFNLPDWAVKWIQRQYLNSILNIMKSAFSCLTKAWLDWKSKESQGKLCLEGLQRGYRSKRMRLELRWESFFSFRKIKWWFLFLLKEKINLIKFCANDDNWVPFWLQVERKISESLLLNLSNKGRNSNLWKSANPEKNFWKVPFYFFGDLSNFVWFCVRFFSSFKPDEWVRDMKNFFWGQRC